MKKLLSFFLIFLFVLSMVGCGDDNLDTGNNSASGSSNIADSSNTQSTISKEKDPYEEKFMDITNFSINKEMVTSAKELDATPKDAVRYIFITDTHIDTTQSQNNEELVLKSLEYAKKMAKETDIAFIALGGDLITGWRDKATAVDSLKKIGEAMVDSPVPVIITRGNHDLNDNPEFPADEEKLSYSEFYQLTQAVVRKDNFIYDPATDTGDENQGLYFYVDFPEAKTRAICLDSFNTKHSAEQTKWLAETALTVKDVGWKYVFLAHIPIDIRYEAEMPHVASGADDIKELVTALNLRSTANCSFGKYDFSDFKSNAVAYNFGHVHNSYMEYNEELKMACIATGQGGCVGDGIFDYVQSDDNHTDRHKLENYIAERYLLDIISTNANETTRIRFGNGSNKTVKPQ